MKLQFDANQEYQLDAIRATVDLFAGQPAGVSDFAFDKAAKVGGSLFSVVANNLILDEETILDNLKSVQKVNDIDESAKLDGLHFSIEMETGTGKTYVYLRAIHEFYKTYDFILDKNVREFRSGKIDRDSYGVIWAAVGNKIYQYKCIKYYI